jgi:hypothetical protein
VLFMYLCVCVCVYVCVCVCACVCVRVCVPGRYDLDLLELSADTGHKLGCGELYPTRLAVGDNHHLCSGVRAVK